MLCFTFFNFAYSLDPSWNNLKQYGCLVGIPDGEAGFVCAPQEFQGAENRRLRFQNKKNECDSYGKNTVEISDGEFDCENAEQQTWVINFKNIRGESPKFGAKYQALLVPGMNKG